MDPLRQLSARLLRLPLFAKVLIANSAVVALGAVVGTYLTTEHVRAAPLHTHYEMMALFGASGLALSIALNALVLRAAFRPLTQLERTARRVTGGDLAARVQLGVVRDPDTETLATSFNHMLDTIQAHTTRLEEYSVRLQELSDQVLMAQEDERRRLARELHDQTGQELSTLLLSLRLFRDAAARPKPDLPGLRAQAAELAELARSTLDGVRTLALELRPRMLDDLGLATALRAYIDEWSTRAGVPVAYRADLNGSPMPST
ncbi:MAG TPA: histidine kinase, partial [Chloroflexota bacterium]|nr:histidine kinase [Chloroflexota bacterium]